MPAWRCEKIVAAVSAYGAGCTGWTWAVLGHVVRNGSRPWHAGQCAKVACSGEGLGGFPQVGGSLRPCPYVCM